jgi:hypothetical protein
VRAQPRYSPTDECQLTAEENAMSPFHPKSPQDIVQIVSQYVRALVGFLFWSIVAASAIAGAYVAARVILVAVKTVLKAVGM